MKKIGYLESLRGLAALIVVFAHYTAGFFPALYWGRPEQSHLPGGIEVALSGTPFNLLYNGDFAVAIFFVLSGFVLSWKFFQQRQAPVILVPLIAKRYVRLLIPVLFSVVLAYLFLKFSLLTNNTLTGLTKSPWLGSFWHFQPDFRVMAREGLFGVFFLNEHTYNNVLRTMTYEFYGSLLVFLFVAFFRNSPRRFLVYAAAVLLSFQSYYLAFVLGILLSDLESFEDSVLKRMKSTPLLVILLLAGLLLGSYPTDRGTQGTVYAFLPAFFRARTWHIGGAFLVMISVLQSRRLQAILSKKPFLFLGTISFSQYILHLLIMCSLSCSLVLVLARTVSYPAAFLLSFCLSLPLIMIASFFTYRVVDRAGIAWSQAVYSRLVRARESFVKRRKPSPV